MAWVSPLPLSIFRVLNIALCDFPRQSLEAAIDLSDKRTDGHPRRVGKVILAFRGGTKNDAFDAGRVDVDFDHGVPLHYVRGTRWENGTGVARIAEGNA